MYINTGVLKLTVKLSEVGATVYSLRCQQCKERLATSQPISSFPISPKDAIRALKKRLNGNKNYREVMLALTVSGAKNGCFQRGRATSGPLGSILQILANEATYLKYRLILRSIE